MGGWRLFWILQISIWRVRIAQIKKCIYQKLFRMLFYGLTGQNFIFRAIGIVQGSQNGMKPLEIAKDDHLCQKSMFRLVQRQFLW